MNEYPRVLVDPADMQALPISAINSKLPSSNQITEEIELVFDQDAFRPASQASTDDSRALVISKKDLKIAFASISDPDIRLLDMKMTLHARLLDRSFSSAFENARISISLWGASASLAVVSALWLYALNTSQERYLQPGLAAAYRLFATLAIVGDLCLGRRGLPAFVFHLAGLITALIAASSDDNLTDLTVSISTFSQNTVIARSVLAFAGSLLSLLGVVGTLIPN
jgi:hypothetical protein